MKKSLLFLTSLFTISCLSSCFGSVTTYHNMVEYSNSEVLEVVKEKYDIEKFLFTDMPIKGKVNKNKEGIYEYTIYSSLVFINSSALKNKVREYCEIEIDSDVKKIWFEVDSKYKDFLSVLEKMNISNIYEQNIQLKEELRKKTTILMVISAVSILIGVVGLFI